MRAPNVLGPLIVLFGVVALLFPLAVIGQSGILPRLSTVFYELARVRQAQVAAGEMLQAQLDKDEAELPRAAGELRARVTDPKAQLDADDAAIAALLADAVKQNVRSLTFRADVAAMQPHFRALYTLWQGRRDAAIRQGERMAFAANGIIAAEVVIFAGVMLLLRRELDRERGVIEALQRIATGELQEHPALEVGTAYFSATQGARIGGDVLDVAVIDPGTAMVVMGDVSGKGLAAAVDTTFIRYALRAFASESRNPDHIVARFNALYAAAGKAPEAFVVLFVGIWDTANGILTYTSAGHGGAFVRRPSRLDVLPPTDPIIGLDPHALFSARTVALGPADTLILATDGVSEARDPQGAFLPEPQVAAWIAGSPAATPQALAHELAADVRSWTHNRPTDDLAILVARKKTPKLVGEHEKLRQ